MPLREVGPLEGLLFAAGRQPFKSNWVRNLSAIVSIMSHRSASCGPSVTITTFQVSSWGFPGVFVGRDRDGQVRRPFADVFHLQPDGGFEFFASVRRLLQVSITGLRRGPGPPPSAIRAGPCLKRGREPLAIRYRHRPLTAGGGPSSQGWCGDNVPTEYRCYSSRNVPAHLLVLFSLGRLPVIGEVDVTNQATRDGCLPFRRWGPLSGRCPAGCGGGD